MDVDERGTRWNPTLESLKILDFYEMDIEFVLRMQPDGGENY
jgi:hypothetical protein